MNIIEEKHYSVDAGMGEKMEGCPYSLFEDGHDVRNYIIPPRGHVLKGFRLEPSDTPVYDGKLIAQFEKEPLRERMSAVWHVLRAADSPVGFWVFWSHSAPHLPTRTT